MLLGRFRAAGRRFATAAAPVLDLRACRAEIAAEHARAGGLAYADPRADWHWLDKELSSNMAGETGAVAIYEGAGAALRLRGNAAEQTLAFVQEHRAAEAQHLALFAELLPEHKHTRLLPAWRMAGFMLGFLPALVSERALFRTVEAVETFVEVHYGEQIGPLQQSGRCPELVRLLTHCCAEEVHHKEDAAQRAGDVSGPGVLMRAWMAVVQIGSAVAADVARRV